MKYLNKSNLPYVFIIFFFLFLFFLYLNKCPSKSLSESLYKKILHKFCSDDQNNRVVYIGENEICLDDDEFKYVDLRIIILTYKRPNSLLKILESLDSLELMGDKGVIEIWVDRGKDGLVDEKTISVGRSFRWSKGFVRVMVQKKHVGIIGQWVDTWKPSLKKGVKNPKNLLDYETALLLEDDISVSRHSYKWLKSARIHFKDYQNISSFTLQGESLIRAKDQAPFNPDPNKTGPSFLYSLISTWGMSPNPEIWKNFQKWFVEKPQNLKPYIPGIIMTNWYKLFEQQNRNDSMWSMWFLYFCHQKKYFSVFSNLINYDLHEKLIKLNETNNLKTPPRACLVFNRKEPGLHYHGKAESTSRCFDFSWHDEYIKFRKEQTAFDFNTNII